MTQPRLIVPGATYLLTRRTVRRYHLFAPDPQTRQIRVSMGWVESCETPESMHEHFVHGCTTPVWNRGDIS